MKKLQLLLVLVVGMFLSLHVAFAADTLPSNSMWVTPPTATPGSTITLNALVYNNTTQDATVTVVFSYGSTTLTTANTIGTVKALVTAGSAQTLSQSWIVPKDLTTVTGTLTSAVNAKGQSVTSLIGVLGTVTVGGSVITPVSTTITFPGSAQLTAWFGPLLANVEVFRQKEAIAFSTLRDTTKVQLGLLPAPAHTTITQPQTPSPSLAESVGINPIKVDSPIQYITLIYATAMASFFSTTLIFYIGIVLIALLVLRFIVNLLF